MTRQPRQSMPAMLISFGMIGLIALTSVWSAPPCSLALTLFGIEGCECLGGPAAVDESGETIVATSTPVEAPAPKTGCTHCSRPEPKPAKAPTPGEPTSPQPEDDEPAAPMSRCSHADTALTFDRPTPASVSVDATPIHPLVVAIRAAAPITASWIATPAIPTGPPRIRTPESIGLPVPLRC